MMSTRGCMPTMVAGPGGGCRERNGHRGLDLPRAPRAARAAPRAGLHLAAAHRPGCGVYQQRVLPDGHADLVVDDRGRAVLVGPATRGVLPELPAGGAVHGLRLAFHAVGPLLRVPAAEIG